jgi:hypothetical protein
VAHVPRLEDERSRGGFELPIPDLEPDWPSRMNEYSSSRVWICGGENQPGSTGWVTRAKRPPVAAPEIAPQTRNREIEPFNPGRSSMLFSLLYFLVGRLLGLRRTLSSWCSGTR